MKRISFGFRTVYGLGELGPAMAGSTMIFFQMVFLISVAGLEPSLAGSVLFIGKIWDAFNDPLIGWLSDRTKTKWGRRLPWIVFGLLPLFVCFVLQWLVPGFVSKQNQWALFTYYVIVALLYSTFYTAVSLSYSALTAEFSKDYDEHSRLTAARMFFSLGGSVGGLVVALIVFELLASAASTTKYLVCGVVISVISILATAVCIVGIWKEAARSQAVAEDKYISARTRMMAIVTNKPYLIVCGIYLCSWMAMQFTATILPFYVQSWLRMSGVHFQIIALVVQATALLLIPMWGGLTVRLGKKMVYLYGMTFWLVAQAGLVFLQPGESTFIYVLAVLAGVGISVCYLIPNAMLPDTIEYDELITRQRREGVYYGFFVFLQKIALALATFIVGQVLSAAGYVSTRPQEIAATQPTSALSAIRISIGPLPALVLIAGMILAVMFPITRERHQRIVELLARRARREN